MALLRTHIMALALVLAAGTAAAQPVVTPYLHANFGDVEIRRGGWGAQLGYHARSLGFELDVDRHHHFFKDRELESIPNPCAPGVMGMCIDNDTDAWIVMGNALGFWDIASARRWRFYGALGAGVIHAWIHGAGEYDSAQTNFALGLGAGAIFRVREWLGLRAEIRLRPRVRRRE